MEMIDNMDHNKYANKFRDKWGTEYELLSEYEGSANPIKMLHTECGRIIEKSASEAVRYGCVHCSRKANGKIGRQSKIRRSNLEAAFIKRLRDKFGDKYTLLGDYVDAKTSTRLRCECGREFNARPDDLLHGPRGCDCAYWKARAEKKVKPPKPKPEPLWTHEKYLIKVKEIWGDEFDVIGEWVNMSTPLMVRHNRCGDEHLKDPYSLIKHYGCNKCSRNSLSSGVILIMQILDEIGTSYDREVKMNGCVNERCLPFDFAIYDDDGLTALIEYDGEQHYRTTKRFGGQRKLELIQKRDRIKNEYCEEHGIPLLRINYKSVERQGKRAYGVVKDQIDLFIRQYQEQKGTGTG